MEPTFESCAVLDLLLNRDNPRHVSKDTQGDVIAYLLADEEVYNLARHMSLNGINPLEVVAVFPDDDGNLIVAEGNRRICAAQLLTDPDKAPEKERKRFKTLASKAIDVSQVNVALFKTYKAAQPWLQVLHDGEQDGVGRKRWKPDQKARATTNKSTDALAVALLDYAEEKGIIDKGARQKVRVSTATRYLANPSVRKAMGIASTATSDKILITTDLFRFDKALENFVGGIRSNKLHSRSVSKDWTEYAGELETRLGKPTDSVPPIEVGAPAAVGSSQSKSAAAVRVPRARLVSPQTRFINKSAPLIAALNELESYKLSSLYKSLTTLALDEHPALLTTGAWMFMETLTALHGRNDSVEFVGYLQPKYGLWGLGKDRIRDFRASMDYIQLHGNAQKHSAIFAAVDAQNLSVHFQVIDDVLIRLTQDCVAARRAAKK
ncbi:hypothetical protein [Mesorhizobium sp. M0146]|uniref:hypothetical protein n=1 Tax=unclassified Mesorhizobium TaxID=325217 RepID=UPI00333A02EE